MKFVKGKIPWSARYANYGPFFDRLVECLAEKQGRRLKEFMAGWYIAIDKKRFGDLRANIVFAKESHGVYFATLGLNPALGEDGILASECLGDLQCFMQDMKITHQASIVKGGLFTQLRKT